LVSVGEGKIAGKVKEGEYVNMMEISCTHLWK
jgi:hypothetical protein